MSPLFKYQVRGAQAGQFLSRVMTRDLERLAPGRVAYCCWCDDAGRLVDDGTVACLAEGDFLVTSGEPMLAWFDRLSHGYRVELSDVTAQFAMLALQGPFARQIVQALAGADVAALPYYGIARGALAGIEVSLSRTGYTGDLGYELWARSGDALGLWDALMEAGRPYGLQPVGLEALDMARVEAGLIMNGVDFFSAHHCLVESRKSSPFELGLERLVELDRGPFIGQAALKAEKARGPERVLVGLEIDWAEYEALHLKRRVPVHLPSGAWRSGVPVYSPAGRRIGQATSGSWSPLLKKNLALATLEAGHGRVGEKVGIEVSVEYERCRAAATVVPRPFYDPARKRA